MSRDNFKFENPDDDSNYVASGDKNMEAFIMNMESEVKFNSDGTVTDAYRENLVNLNDLLMYENIHVSYLPILKFQGKTYGMNHDLILTIDDIRSALENKKIVIMYLAINDSLNKFRAFII